MLRYTILLMFPIFLAACASAPLKPLPSNHPASPAAAEAPIRSQRSSLSGDAMTSKTKELLSDKSPQENSMPNMPGMQQ